MRSLNFSRIARTVVVVWAAALATAAPMLVASPAQAASGDHCMITLPEPGSMRCFETFEEAKRFAESLGEQFGPGKGEAAVTPAARSVTPASVVLVLRGIEYDSPLWNPVGGSRWVWGLGPCTGPINNIDGSVSDWGVYGFDQRISSFQTFNNCWAKHYDLVNFGGLAVGYQGSQAVINPSLNNDTSSELWS